VLELLEEHRHLANEASEMRALQERIEIQTMADLKDPSDASRRCRKIMSMLVKSDMMPAKEYILTFCNRLSVYEIGAVVGA
jgi:hypothetical protein